MKSYGMEDGDSAGKSMQKRGSGAGAEAWGLTVVAESVM